MLEIGASTVGFWWEPTLVCTCPRLVVPSCGGKRAGELAAVPFIKTLVPFMKAVPS